MKKEISILCTAPVSKDVEERAAVIDGLTLDIIPFIEIEYVADTKTSSYIADIAGKELNVVLTSKNGAIAVANMLRGKDTEWTIFCLGNKTKSVVLQHFKKNKIISECDNAHQLCHRLIGARIRDVTFFCSDSRMDILPDALAKVGVVVDECIVYKTKETPHPIASEYDGVLFFSPSAVRSYFSCNNAKERTVLFAIGDTTADEIKKYSNARVISSKKPSKEQMVFDAIDHIRQMAGKRQ